MYKAIIEIPKGDDRRRHKNYAGTAIEDFGPIKDKIPVNNGVMPVAYGFIVNTKNQEEGDEVDVLVFSNKNFQVGEEVEIKPIGLIFRDDKDHKVIAVDDSVDYQNWQAVPSEEGSLIVEYFGYNHKIEAIEDTEKALEYLKSSSV